MISKEDIDAVNPRELVRKTHGDRYLWLIVIALTMISCLTIYSSTGTLAYKLNQSNEHYLLQQVAFVLVGLGLMYLAHVVHYKFYSRFEQVLRRFKKQNPDCVNFDSKKSDKYNKMMVEAYGGSGNEDFENENKIIKNISKEVMINKDNEKNNKSNK